MTTGMFHPHETKGARRSSRYNTKQWLSIIPHLSGSTTDQVGNPAILIRVQHREIPEAAIYQAWLDGTKSSDPRAGNLKATGEKLRRAVRMIRNGYTVADCERTLGGGLRAWIAKLPPELAA